MPEPYSGDPDEELDRSPQVLTFSFILWTCLIAFSSCFLHSVTELTLHFINSVP